MPNLPYDTEKDLAADNTFLWPQLIAEKRFFNTGQLKLGVNVGYRFHTQSNNTRFDQLKITVLP